MKAEIDENGKLTITPENKIELFALKQWWNNYTLETDNQGAGRFAVLEVCTIDEHGLK